MSLRIHAICLALNEEPFIEACIDSIYDHCSGISVVSQYDRDYYNNPVKPDQTIKKVLDFPDPQGKIHTVVRRYKDETVARNHEMQALLTRPYRGVMSHGVPMSEIKMFHQTPDYFLIVDADEIYDKATIPNIIDYLEKKAPRGMRVSAYQYGFTWNERMPLEKWRFRHFGFIKAGMMFEMRRKISWKESRIQNFCKKLRLPDISGVLFGFINCPIDVGVFHHASYIGGLERLESKFQKHSHQEVKNQKYIERIKRMDFGKIDSSVLPVNIKSYNWPSGWLKR
jgi:hypothetical protein